ncbi:phosphate signaling complex protein PhoU [Fontivita pretiosa]|uniref:phosphate signaling complex protein PhoU n=1 Tax=Fontivita pretiosa TaxID=2989684 RepID=UPI003D181B15
MSHHFIDLLEQLKGRVARMTAMVQQSVEQAVEAVFTLDEKLQRQVIAADNDIDEEEVRIEKQAIDLLALYQPAAGDLRLITTIIKVNSDFERIADCAVNIAQRVQFLRQLDGEPDQTGRYEPPQDLRVMANSVIATLRDTIQAFNLGDEQLARRVLRGDDVVDALYQQFVQEMLAVMAGHSHRPDRDLSHIMIAKNLERIADHCTNIAEDVIYVHSGRIVRHQHSA